jgi:hypothetical protein
VLGQLQTTEWAVTNLVVELHGEQLAQLKRLRSTWFGRCLPRTMREAVRSVWKNGRTACRNLWTLELPVAVFFSGY